MSGLLPEFSGPEYASYRSVLGRLAVRPPQTLLLEGASSALRMEAGKYWAMLHSCPSSLSMLKNGKEGAPCMACPACRQIDAGEWLDLQLFDGSISNRQDEENPGLVRALRMENIRELKSLLAASPRGNGKRVVIAQGMGITREEAQNSLLKVLEEPSPHNFFVLLVTQRQQILPTLVSRSFCVSFPWNGSERPPSNPALGALLQDLENFLESGQGFLEKIGQKGVLDGATAGALVFELEKSVVRGCAKNGGQRRLDAFFGRMSVARIATVSHWLRESLEMLELGVAPARVLEGLASRLFVLGKKEK